MCFSGRKNKKERARWKKMCEEYFVVNCKRNSPYFCDECVLLRWKKVTRFSYQVKEGEERWVNVNDLTQLVPGFEEEVAKEGEIEEEGEPLVNEPTCQVIGSEENFEFRLPIDEVGKTLTLEYINEHLRKQRVKVLCVVLCEKEVKVAFEKFHTNSGHCSWDSLLAKINSSYYFPQKHHQKLRELFDNCLLCKTLRKKPNAPPPPPESINIMSPGAFWQMDHAGPFPEDVCTKAR